MIVSCPNCGARFRSAIQFPADASITVENCAETCPACWQIVELPNGVHGFGDLLYAAIREEGLTFARVAELVDQLERVKAGKVSLDDAANTVSEFSAGLAHIVRALGTNGVAIQSILTFLTFLLMILQFRGNNADEAVAHADRRAQIEATDRQTEVYRKLVELQMSANQNDARATKALQQLGASVARLNQDQQRALRGGERSFGAHKPGPNRHERRRAASHARRAPKT